MSEKLYNGLEPKNEHLTKAAWGGRLHLRKLEPMTASLHRRKKEAEKANASK